MGGFVEHSEQERQVINQEQPGGSHGQAQSELLLSVPDAQIHQVIEREEQAFPLAEGTLTIVSVSLPGHENRIGLVAKVGEFEYPLAKDTACLRSSPHQYVFVLSDGVIIGLTLPGDTPPEAVDLFELLLEQCCDFAVQQDGSAGKPGEVLIMKPENGERQEVAVDSTGWPQQRGSAAAAANQAGLGSAQNPNQGKNRYVVSGPDAPSPSPFPPATSESAAVNTGRPGSQPTGVNKYVVSGPGMPAAPPGLSQGTAPGTSAYDGPSAYGGVAAYGAVGQESQVPVVHPDGSVTGAQRRPKKVGERLAAIVGTGAAMLGQGIVKGGEWTASKIQEHGQKQKAKMVPNERPAEISPSIQTGVRGANQASRAADATAKKVVGGAVYVITAVASSVGAAVHAVGGSQPGKEPKVGARALAVASVDGIAHVFDALEASGKRVMATSREVGSDLMQHKYGAQAGQLTSDGMSTLGHMIHAGWTIRKLAFRTVARSAATNTALHVIRGGNGTEASGNGTETQAISGWNTAPAQRELDEARRANQASVAVGMI